jgi:hypothetical protein
VEIAIATQTAPCDWWEESDEVIATALDVLNRHAKQVKQANRRR